MRTLLDRDNFIFTQQSLTTFLNCPLKFKKKYIENLFLGNINDNQKASLNIGKDFHLLAQRYFLGIDVGLQEDKKEHLELSKWINSLKTKFPDISEGSYLPEHKLRRSTSEYKLEANFDLLFINKNKVEIWDWKTHNTLKTINKQSEVKLINSYQTIVYLFMLKENMKLVTKEEIPAKNISMQYWQPDPSKIVAEINYSEELHEKFRTKLESEIQGIYNYDYSLFNKELYKKHCKYCEFNWLCNEVAAEINGVDEDYEDF